MASEEPAAAAAAAPSPLEKPLKDLTEEDIAQLTREDCRRFLKQKGMRRPSWNKSQAIQQVISLKTLLEGPPPDDTPVRVRFPSSLSLSPSPSSPTHFRSFLLCSRLHLLHPPPPLPPTIPRRRRRGTCSGPATPPPSPPRRDGMLRRGESMIMKLQCFSSKAVMDDRDVGQMTIFYCGKVNVYEDIHPDKAKAVMLLAGSPSQSPSGTAAEALPVAQPLTPFQTTSYANMTSGKGIQITEDLKSAHDNDYDGPASRKASLQRYLEKRNDRLDLSKRHMRL